MEAYAQVLSYAIPGFILLIILESIVAKRMGMQVNYGMDTISSLSSGMTNTVKNLTGLSIVILSYEWMVSHFAVFEIKSTVWLYLLAFIGIDFAGYWSHRFDHVVNLFWNRHIVHHSSEEFNLACALRQSISAVVGIYFFLYIPMAIIGIPGEVVAITAPLHLFAQFWYHTRLIGRMGFLEHIIVTPSHHRVHHAINPEYIDKNFSQIFIFWDKWFGTFQEELPDVPPVYGTKVPANTWNPVLINFMHVWSLAKDAWRTRKWWDKIRLWFMPTGWRPEDVKEKYPVYTVKDIYHRPKYHTDGSPFFQGWVWFQLVINNLLLYHMMVQIGDYTFPEILLYAAVLMVSIFGYTALMDHHATAFPAELAKLVMGFGLIYATGGWFKIDEMLAGGTVVVAIYLVASAVMAGYFHFFKRSATV